MISPGTIRAAVGQTTASYPVPFLLYTLCGSGLIVFITSLLQPVPARMWAGFALSCLLFISALGMARYALVFQPKLLRTERTAVTLGAMGIFGDDEVGDLAKDRIGHALDSFLTNSVPARTRMVEDKTSLSQNDTDGDEDE